MSDLQADLAEPTVRSLLKANALVVSMKRNADFALTFRPLDLDASGVLVISDAALGNVTRTGSTHGTPATKTFSQAGYVIAIADPSLMSGELGQFNMIDARSHRLQRVCRSSYAAETLGLEEAMDAAHLIRGMLAELRGIRVRGQNDLSAVAAVSLTAVVDAKDTHDKVCSDTSSHGQQKSLAFSVAWLKQQFKAGNTSLRWCATDNMVVDALTKEMDTTHLRRVLTTGQWSIRYNSDFVRQRRQKTTTATSTKESADSINWGSSVPEEYAAELEKLARQPGWHISGTLGVQVARNASSFRTPTPRLSTDAFPRRSTYVRFIADDKRVVWRCLEDKVEYVKEANMQSSLGIRAEYLVSVFHRKQADDVR